VGVGGEKKLRKRPEIRTNAQEATTLTNGPEQMKINRRKRET